MNKEELIAFLKENLRIEFGPSWRSGYHVSLYIGDEEISRTEVPDFEEKSEDSSGW